ncbi:hypothetical protein BKG80_24545 [Mycobacteroides chelonae]|nr:hypothetical protein AOT86_25180 [Mycobacteroides sp. H072]KRQ39615.1 hypothetical protein AOT84_06740 [Mycobacteroides sp. H002]KRQ54285.1 hypothetical protein AOT85_04875 [Mycobacteroides sp. H054]OHU34021.1 hypothetical protein BKG80_24545 [Mycobacteroides chelonae]OHU41061.1 hypothetical protein BKG79_08605 [Mycobacteroides chelonae]
MRAAQGMRERTASIILMTAGVVVMIALGEGHTFHAAGYAMAVLFGLICAHSWFNPLLLQARSTILTEAARRNISSMGLSALVILAPTSHAPEFSTQRFFQLRTRGRDSAGCEHVPHRSQQG